MSENCERMPLPATETNGSEKWDPPLWSPGIFIIRSPTAKSKKRLYGAVTPTRVREMRTK